MTDKKLTDKEIISSLEVIATTGNCEECEIRNCKWGTCNCSQITANMALDLINCQKSEIERLKKEVSVARDAYISIQDRYEHTKAESYKEFAGIIKDKWFDNRYDSPDVDFDDFILNLLKEMVSKRRMTDLQN